MGVAGSGKTTVAKLFAEKTGAVFYEGDDFHPPENVAKMSAGVPLTDADRAIWLTALPPTAEYTVCTATPAARAMSAMVVAK